MNVDPNPNNTDAPIVPADQPVQPTSIYNPFGAPPPEPSPITTPIEPQPISQPPKKSRKKLIVGLIITTVIVIVSAIGITLFVNNQATQAKTAASQYRKDVLAHLDGVLTLDNYKDRVAIWRNTAKLKNVQFGASLSKEYKDALDLKSRYESIITDGYPAILDRYASTDLSPFLKDLQAALGVKIPSPEEITPGKSTYAATLAANKEYVTLLKKKADSFQTLATRAKTYVYPEKYRESQAGVVTALENMSHTWNSMATEYTAYIGEAESAESAAEKGDINSLDQQINTLSANQAERSTRIATIGQDYLQYTKDLTANDAAMVNAMIADGWFATSQENVMKVGEKVDKMREELK